MRHNCEPISARTLGRHGLKDRQSRLRTAAANTGAGGSGEVVDLALRSIGSLLLARLLGPHGLGTWLVARTVAFDLGGIVARSGLDEAVLRFVSHGYGRGEKREANGAFRAGLRGVSFTSISAVVLLLALAPFLADKVFHKPESLGLIRMIAPSLLIIAPTFVLLSAIQGVGLLRLRVAAQKLAFPLLNVCILGVAIATHLGMTGAVAAHYAGLTAMAFVAWVFGRRSLRSVIGKESGKSPLRPLGSYAAPLALAEAGNFVVLWTDIIMLGILSSSVQTGIYGVAMRIGSLVWLPLHAVNQMFSPMIAVLHGQGEKSNLEEMFQLSARWIVFASLPIFVLILFAGKWLLSLFGPGFIIGGSVLLFLASGKLIAAGTGSVGFMLNMTGHQKLNLVNSLILGVVNAVLNYFWIMK